MKIVKIGKHVIPLWLMAVILVSGIGSGVLGYYIWKTLTIPLEVKEPIEILYYPSQLSLYPGETEQFNITLHNKASVNYSVVLDFSLDNITYQDSYVAFSNEVYTVIPGQQNLTAWLMIKSHAPPANASLTIDFSRITDEETVLFFDDFNDGVADGWTEHLGTWSVVNGEYLVTAGFVENGMSTVNELDLTNCIIEVILRFKDTSMGFKAGIMFRYTDNEHYYQFVLSNEYDNICLTRYAPGHSDYGVVPHIAYVEEGDYIIQPNIDYLLKIVILGNTFTCFVNGEGILSGTDGNYTTGKVGLWARNANVFFDNFNVTRIP